MFKACCGEAHIFAPSRQAQKAWLNFFFRAISLNYFICCKTILPPSSQAQKAWLNFFFRAISLDYFIGQNGCLPRAKPKKNLAQFLLKTMSLKPAVGRANLLPPSSLAQKTWLNFFFRAISLD